MLPRSLSGFRITLLCVIPASLLSLQGIGFGGLEADVQVKQAPVQSAPIYVEVVVEGQARELPRQVYSVLLAVHRVVEHSVGVGKDVLCGDAAVRIDGLKVLAPLFLVVLVDELDAPLSNVADPLAVVCVTVQGEALGLFESDASE